MRLRKFAKKQTIETDSRYADFDYLAASPESAVNGNRRAQLNSKSINALPTLNKNFETLNPANL